MLCKHITCLAGSHDGGAAHSCWQLCSYTSFDTTIIGTQSGASTATLVAPSPGSDLMSYQISKMMRLAGNVRFVPVVVLRWRWISRLKESRNY